MGQLPFEFGGTALPVSPTATTVSKTIRLMPNCASAKPKRRNGLVSKSKDPPFLEDNFRVVPSHWSAVIGVDAGLHPGTTHRLATCPYGVHANNFRGNPQ